MTPICQQKSQCSDRQYGGYSLWDTEAILSTIVESGKMLNRLFKIGKCDTIVAVKQSAFQQKSYLYSYGW